MPNAKGTTAAAARHKSAPAVNQRADAQRSRAKILAATPVALRKNPDASVADIAAEAGVGRMTLYGHFANREALIDATLTDSLEQAERSEEHTSELQSRGHLVCRLLLEKKKSKRRK